MASHFAVLSVMEGTTSGLLTIAIAAGVHSLARFRRTFMRAIDASNTAQTEAAKAATASRDATVASREATDAARANAHALDGMTRQLRELTSRMETVERSLRGGGRRGPRTP